MTGIYIHIPFCGAKCRYCDFASFACPAVEHASYIDALILEIRRRAPRDRAAVDTIYFGGGTPSIIDPKLIGAVMGAVRECFSVDENAEITLEGNPDSLTLERLTAYKGMGINRISMGVQSHDDSILRKIGRIHTYAQAVKAAENIKAVGITNYNIDLMLGLPDQTAQSARKSLKSVLALNPAHISLYGLKVEEGTPLYREGYAPDEDLTADMYDDALETLKGQGYNRYEVSNFALVGRESRHNLKYWRLEDYYGFGLSAHSCVGRVRSFNPSTFAEYYEGESASETVGEAERKTEFIMLALRTAEGIGLDRYRAEFGTDFVQEFGEVIAKLKSKKLVHCDGRRFVLTDAAYYVMNSVLVEFLD